MAATFVGAGVVADVVSMQCSSILLFSWAGLLERLRGFAAGSGDV